MTLAHFHSETFEIYSLSYFEMHNAFSLTIVTLFLNIILLSQSL